MFTGFSQKTIDFMWNIRLNNNKQWFEAHKDDFKRDFQTPMKELGQHVEHPALIYSVGDKVPAKVIEFDLDGQKIVLSVAEYFKGNAESFEKYKSEHPVRKGVTIEKIRAEEEAAKSVLKETEDEE